MSSDSMLANLPLTPDVLRENDPDPNRVLFWLKGDRRDSFQYWERVAGHMLEPGAAARDLATLPVRVTPFRQRIGTDLRKLFSRFRGANDQSASGFILPTGEWAEALGQPREDALLAWTMESESASRSGIIDEIWPGKEMCRQLGPRLFLVVGVKAPLPPARRASANGNGKHADRASVPDTALIANKGPGATAPSHVANADAPPSDGAQLSDRDVQQWLQRMSRQVAFHCDEGYWPLALGLAEQVLKWVRKRRGEEHPQTAACLNQVGRVHQLRGDMAAAEPYYRDALRMNGQLLGVGHPSFATGLNNLALLQQSLGNGEAAAELHRQALDLRVASLGEGHPLVATSQNNLGLMHLAAGDAKMAEPLLARAVENIRATLGPEHPDLAICVQNLAAVCRALGEAERAARLAEEAGRIREAAVGRDYLRIAESLNILAEAPSGSPNASLPPTTLHDGPTVVEMVVHPHDNADPSPGENVSGKVEEKPALLESDLDRDAATTEGGAIADLSNEWTPNGEEIELADLDLDAAAELWEAEVPAEEAAAFAEQNAPVDVFRPVADAGPPKDNDVGYIAEDLLLEEIRQNEDIEAAEIHIQPVAEEVVIDPVVPAEVKEVPEVTSAATVASPPVGAQDDDTDYWEDLASLGEEPEDGASIPHPGKTLEPAASAAGPAADEAPPVSETVSDPADLIRLADQSHSVGDYRGAEALYERALETGTGRPEAGSAQRAHALNGLAATRAATGRVTEALDLLLQVLSLDASLLVEALGPGGEDRRDTRLYWVRADVRAIVSLVSQRLAHSSDAVQAAFDAVLRYKNIGVDIRDGALETHSDLEGARAASCAALARALLSESVLVEIIRLRMADFQPTVAHSEEPGQAARYVAFILSAGEPDAPRVVDLGDADEIDRKTAAFRAAITGAGSAPNGPRRVTGPHVSGSDVLLLGADLRRTVFDPLAACFGGRVRLFLAPEGDLACLPFEALPTDDDGYVLDTYRISYLTAGRDVLDFGTADACEPNAPVVGGDPDFDLGLPATTGATAGMPMSAAWRIARDEAGPATLFPRLAGTRRSARAVADLLGVEAIMAGSVRKSWLDAVRSPWILHLATHCFFSTEPPRGHGADECRGDGPPGEGECGLVLSGANRQRHGKLLPALGMQGFMTATEIAALDLSGTELVVLPSSTASAGDQVVELRGAFARAGAQSLVMSQWKVPDWHAKVLLLEFYGRLLDGEPRAEALRQAQLALRQLHPNRPGYWGAFICHGDPGPLRRRVKSGRKR